MSSIKDLPTLHKRKRRCADKKQNEKDATLADVSVTPSSCRLGKTTKDGRVPNTWDRGRLARMDGLPLRMPGL